MADTVYTDFIIVSNSSSWQNLIDIKILINKFSQEKSHEVMKSSTLFGDILDSYLLQIGLQMEGTYLKQPPVR